jgi:alkylhydroperoxidase family enzyme
MMCSTLSRMFVDEPNAQTAADVIAGVDATGLTARERAIAKWARRVVKHPSATSEGNVAELRAAGLTEREIVEVTTLAAFRVAFSIVNDALAAGPDREVAEAAPDAVRRAVTFGRPPP